MNSTDCVVASCRNLIAAADFDMYIAQLGLALLTLHNMVLRLTHPQRQSASRI